MKRTLFALAAVATAASSQALFLNEVFINVPGADDGQEFFEIYEPAGSVPLVGLHFLSIEGDGTSAGTVDQALDLSTFSTGPNGLFLWRDSTDPMIPPPDGLTSIHVSDFSPDLENGSNTFAIVSGWSGTVGMDLDTDNDGTLDIMPWSGVLDSVGWTDGGASDHAYGPHIFTGLTFTPHGAQRTSDSFAWVGYEVTGAAPGPYPVSDTAFADIMGTALDPMMFDKPFVNAGSTNMAVVPEPASMIALGAGLLALARRRNRK